MQVSRLFQIVYLLLESGGMTANTLAQHFEVSTRTIYRDVEALSEAGIPIYADRGKGGGIRLLPNFVLNRSLLSEQEQDTILFALQGLKATTADEESQLLSQLNALFRRQQQNWIQVDFSEWGFGEQQQQIFSQLRSGILEKRLVDFVYYGADGNRSQRLAAPVKLWFKQGAWYFQGFCLTRRAYRLFKICRMDQVRLTDKCFPSNLDAPPPLDADIPCPDNLTRLRLRFSPRAAYRVYEMFGRENPRKQADGSLEVECAFPGDNWLRGFLLSFGEDLEVLEPPAFREMLGQQALRMLSIYGKDISG